ncbi:MAG TPA: aminotransferase class I/II-fold pyridoxal phosphate-dependent enzyme, partial [Aquaticitalea sp.]|nr:aminotransferase class I/II-fold pyridoxal phosphate-dependent enzyme [Aquaticitalea sp.]
GMFVWAKLPHGTDAIQFVDKLLKEKSIFLAPGNIFGSQGNGYVRISLCAPTEEFEKAISRVDKTKSMKDELTESQIAFLKKYNFGMEDMFDAKGLTTIEYMARMKAEGKRIAYNADPCKKEGHTLRTKSGHCAQCNTYRFGVKKTKQKNNKK